MRARSVLEFILVAAFAALMPMSVFAVQPDEILPDAGLEHRARTISGGLRCLVCQNQSIDDSDAPLAKDLRLIVRERLKAGDDDSAVVNYVVARYGDFVLLKPPLKTSTIALWLSPLVLLFGGLWLGRKVMGAGRGGANENSGPLTADERKRLDAILKDSDSAA